MGGGERQGANNRTGEGKGGGDERSDRDERRVTLKETRRLPEGGEGREKKGGANGGKEREGDG
jgi:hypothetical protein